MKLSTLVLIITEDCNFNCKYCYQKREKKYMTLETAKKTIDFFLPRAEQAIRICFLGGEPFLGYGLIKEIIAHTEQKNKKIGKTINFATTTNGSLLDDSMLDYLDDKRFVLGCSFDGFEQEVTRSKNSFDHTKTIIEKIKQRKHIHMHTVSTFNTMTVERMSRSMEYILDMEIPKMSLALDLTRDWNMTAIDAFTRELDLLRDIAVKNYRLRGTNPISLFTEPREKGIWHCTAGESQLTVTVDGQIWGCSCIYERFRDRQGTPEHDDYYFGNIYDFRWPFQSFERKCRRIMENYSLLRMDNFYTDKSRCFLCPDVEQCEVCPVAKVSSTKPLLYVEDYICRIIRQIIKQPEKFKQAIADVPN